MAYFYSSGERIEEGDAVILAGKMGRVELVADPDLSPNDWYATELGAGVLIVEPEQFGRIFLTPGDDDFAELRLVARRTTLENTDRSG